MVWGGTRTVQALGTDHGYKAGQGLVSVRWVFVRDTTGTHRDEYFFTTDSGFTPMAIIGYYCGRGNIETTFQEARSALGLETTRGWRENTVLRAGPCLLGLYSVVAFLFHARPGSKRVGAVSWPGKTTVTFPDALSAVRRWLWAEALLLRAGADAVLDKLPTAVREVRLTTLAPAA
ncbi:Transposase family protein OS=Singulisphaera acidiphila (strain ATCC BAA-1392 / DSM 18658 / VKM B-2454 / MOB10) GN=Sinac_1230 PE=4 SV=1 [Gemmata massiliana]|uniref:Transposase family protein n=1 Tax=Gemmata massiliana TaxID=1210884 RepID=A0A6P2CYD5_9BACT|nr:Transposase family protein OS=Singulisphaera acidiphila (strain ATCC BAA-1392 / DSM 18658 / VKM B-2454 / MOB10) GN=Sinac_1230 PE=4 SV=1 [Gemmata massiliana]